MCLFTSALGMFTVTTRYQCIIASGSECVCSMFTSLCLQLRPDHDHDVVQCIIASISECVCSGDVYRYHLTMTMTMTIMLSNVSLHRCLFTSGDVYSYHLTMTMMLSRMFRMCLFWGCLQLPPDTLVASVTMTKSGSSLPPQSNSDAILSQAKSVPR